MRLMINGEYQQLPELHDGSSLQRTLQQLGYLAGSDGDACPSGTAAGSNAFVVALNQKIVSASLYATTQVQDDDAIDVLGAITGG